MQFLGTPEIDACVCIANFDSFELMSNLHDVGFDSGPVHPSLEKFENATVITDRDESFSKSSVSKCFPAVYTKTQGQHFQIPPV